MGFLPQFEHDFFVSYRRASNEGHDRWVDLFCEALRVSLKELVGEVTIWRDPQLRVGATWRPEVVQALDRAAIFLAIVSRTYFDSDECRKELDEFLGRVKRELAGSGASRKIVPIFKQPLKPDQELPPELSAINRHDFFDWDPPGSPHFRELRPDSSEEEKRAFWAALARVAQDLMLTLEDLSGHARKSALGRVFLARVSPELQLDRERLRSDLQMRRFIVAPEREYLWNADDHLARITSDLEEAELCVHIVARTMSIDPMAALRAKQQLELAYKAMKRKGRHPPLVWIQPAPATDPSAGELLRYIERDLANDGIEYWQGGLEDFKTNLYTLLPSAAPRAQPRSVMVQPQIALLVEEGDVPDLQPITAVLVDRLGVEPRRVQFAGSVPKDPSRLSSTLEKSQLCMIFWARQPEGWVTDLLENEVLASLPKGRTCIYAAAPATPEKLSFRSVRARTIVADGLLNESDLRAFLPVETREV